MNEVPENAADVGTADAGAKGRDLRPLDFLNVVTFRAAVVVVLAVLTLIIQNMPGWVVTGLPGLVVGSALIGSAIAELGARLRGKRKGRPWWQAWIMAPVELAAGILLIATSADAVYVIALVLGGVLIISGIISVLRGLRRGIERAERSLIVFTGVFQFVLGVLVFLFPENVVTTLVFAVASWWVAQGVISVSYQIRAQPTNPTESPTSGALNPADTGEVIMLWLTNHSRSDKSRDELIPKIFYEGAVRGTRLQRFAVLMFLSTTIATFGLIGNSTAVVIGAMLIAPLMTPIMGLSASLISAWPRRATSSALTVLAGATGAIAVSYVLSYIAVQVPSSVLQNSEITSRTQPTLLDLGIALAAGAAGAFALSRSDISDSLPGAAVAIALVPPLATIGVTLQAGSPSDAFGALLLFVTNFVGIIIAGSLVFVLLGVAPLARSRQQSRLVKTSFAVVGISTIIIVVPLAYTGYDISSSQYSDQQASAVVDSWLGENNSLSTIGVQVSGNDVEVVLLGDTAPPPPDDLAHQLSESLKQDIDLTIRVVPEQQFTATATT